MQCAESPHIAFFGEALSNVKRQKNSVAIEIPITSASFGDNPGKARLMRLL